MTTSRRRPQRRETLVASARVLAGREAAGMAEIAAGAGIARGTLYRYFPNRQSLLRTLEAAANEAATQCLAEANLDQVPVDEALARNACSGRGRRTLHRPLARTASSRA